MDQTTRVFTPSERDRPPLDVEIEHIEVHHIENGYGIACAKVDNRVFGSDIDGQRIEVREPVAGDVDHIDTLLEVADNIISAAQFKDEGVGTFSTKDHVIATTGIDHVIARTRRDGVIRAARGYLEVLNAYEGRYAKT